MKKQTHKLYALAAVLGILESGNPDDNFHVLVHRITGKYHVSELTSEEAGTVEAELRKMLGSSGKEDIPDMMTRKQKWLARQLASRLAELDGNENATVNQRLAGTVRKTLGITAPPDDPLRWVRKADGIKLIEALKKIVSHAEKKQNQK